MDMVRRGLMLSFLDASCCKVEVMNGGAGERLLSCRLILLTEKGAVRMASKTSSTCSLDFSSIFFSRP